MTLDLDKLEADAQRAKRLTPHDYGTHCLLNCDEFGFDVPHHDTATHIANCSPDTILELVRLARLVEAIRNLPKRESALMPPVVFWDDLAAVIGDAASSRSKRVSEA